MRLYIKLYSLQRMVIDFGPILATGGYGKDIGASLDEVDHGARRISMFL